MLTKTIQSKLRNLKLWWNLKQMASIALELFKRKKAINDEEGLYEWTFKTHEAVQEMFDTDHKMLTKLFLEIHKKDMMAVLETYHKIVETG